MANSVQPDETARHEPSHLDLHCLHRYWSAMLKGLTWKILTFSLETTVFSLSSRTDRHGQTVYIEIRL